MNGVIYRGYSQRTTELPFSGPSPRIPSNSADAAKVVAARDWLAGAKALAPASALKIKATFMVDFQFADGCESSRKQYRSKPNNVGEMDREVMFRWLLPSSFSNLTLTFITAVWIATWKNSTESGMLSIVFDFLQFLSEPRHPACISK